jgi:plastocyanin
MRNIRKWPYVLSLMAVLVLAGPGLTEDSRVRKDFTEAFKANDRKGMAAVVRNNMESIPAEIQALLDEANSAGEREVKDVLLTMVEFMATIYKDLSGDVEFFRVVKQRIFDALLSPPVRSVPQGGVHVVDMPLGTATVRNKFSPDNIIIEKGSTVRWVNRDTVMHLLGSMPFIGKGGLFSPDIETGRYWEYTFEETGEYFYICFIHSDMYGKVTVVESFEEET